MPRRAYMFSMKRIAVIFCAALLATSATAEGTDTREGLSLMERGAQMFLRGLLEDMEPAMDELRTLADEFGPQMQEFMQSMGPALADLINRVDDLAHYEAPEILPNGDIIIRRKPDAPEYVPQPPQGTDI